MISVGSRDGRRKGLELGYGSGAEMAETELEEGEACSYHYNDGGDDATIDPDVVLSYLDEKLQHVLGHLQKDFEGGVSAESLGAKFGAYGSFLPTYQRSPVRSQPKVPTEGQKPSTPRSSNILQLEDGHHKNVTSSNASFPEKQEHASATSVSLPSLRTPVCDSAKGDTRTSSANCAGESSLKCELGKSNVKSSGTNTLKLRIKLGSDFLSTQKNSDIYSGLGLDISPTSSMDGSPSSSEGLYCEPLTGPDESPTSILETMTSLPLIGNKMLSPLSDSLIYLTEKRKLHCRSKPRFLEKGGQESSNGCVPSRADEKRNEGIKPERFEEKFNTLKTETNIDSLACEELVANALKLPLLSNSYPNIINSAKDTARAGSQVKEESLSDLSKRKISGSLSVPKIGLVEKHDRKASSAVDDREDEKMTFPIDIPVHTKKDNSFKGNASAMVFSEAESNISKLRKHQDSRKDSLSSGKKRKGQSYSDRGAEVPKHGSQAEYHVVSRDRKNAYDNGCLPDSEIKNSQSQKDNEKANNRYKEFFGEIELEEGDNDAHTAEKLSTDKAKKLATVEKTTSASTSVLNDRSKGSKVDKSLISEPISRVALDVTQSTGSRSMPNVASVPQRLLGKENWVCCDQCGKRRLLPDGMDPKTLPEKWLCSMLEWLPGLNRCSISEEETNRALVDLYQVPVPGNQKNQHDHPSRVAAGLSMTDANHIDQKHQNFVSLGVSGGYKIRLGIKGGPVAMTQDGPAKLSLSVNKNEESTKGKSSNDAHQSLAGNETGLGKSNVVEKHKQKHKHKKKRRETHDVGDEAKSSKRKGKRSADQSYPKSSKKGKTDSAHCNNGDLGPGHGGHLTKVDPSSCVALSVNTSEKDPLMYGHQSSESGEINHTKCHLSGFKDQQQVASEAGSLQMGNLYDEDVARKRKTNDTQEIHTDQRDFLKQSSESLDRKEKKAKLSDSQGKENNSSGSSGVRIKNIKSKKDQQFETDIGSNPYHRSMNVVDTSGKDLGSSQPSQAATSSSSKISGSRKSRDHKTCVQEMTGSPVESVSSSPRRFAHADKSAVLRNSVKGKDDTLHAGLLSSAAPGRCMDGEHEREQNQSEPVRKDEAFVQLQRSQEPVLDNLPGTEPNPKTVQYPESENQYPSSGFPDTVGNCKPQTSGLNRDDEGRYDRPFHADLSRPKKSRKESSLRLKEKNGELKPEPENSVSKISDSFNGSRNQGPGNEELPRSGKIRDRGKLGPDCVKLVKSCDVKEESRDKVASEESGRHRKTLLQEDVVVTDTQDVLLNHDERPAKKSLSDKIGSLENSGKRKSNVLATSGRSENERVSKHTSSNPSTAEQNCGKSSLIDASNGDGASEAPEQVKRSEKPTRNQSVRHKVPTANGHRVREAEAPSPSKRDSHTQAATKAVKEAKDLKHLADRLKSTGASAESTSLYFQAALKFLHGASLLESNSSRSSKQGESIQSIQMYSSTAKLCEFCAHEYEKSKDMAAAALAYKCMEVGYMKVVYSSHARASRERHELQTAVQICAPGESPSSSASDVDNINNPATADKVSSTKGVSPSQVAGNYVIAARNRSSYARLLNFSQDVNFAMDASRKSRLAFAAATPRKDQAGGDGLSTVKRALNYNFQDVDGLLQLVRQAMEAISR